MKAQHYQRMYGVGWLVSGSTSEISWEIVAPSTLCYNQNSISRLVAQKQRRLFGGKGVVNTCQFWVSLCGHPVCSRLCLCHHRCNVGRLARAQEKNQRKVTNL